MQRKTRRKLEKRKRRTRKRIDKANWNGQSPMLDPPTIHYELAERTQAIAAAELGIVQQLARKLFTSQSQINALADLRRKRLVDEVGRDTDHADLDAASLEDCAWRKQQFV